MTTQMPDAVRECENDFSIAQPNLREALEAVADAMLNGGDGAVGDFGWNITKLNRARPLIRAALDSRAGDAGEAIGYQVRIAYGEWHPALCSEAEAARMVANVDSAVCEMRPVYAATPAPAVDAVPAGEVERWTAERPLAAAYDDNRQYQVAMMAWEKRRAPAADIALAEEVTRIAAAALKAYADPTDYTDANGEPYREGDPHPGTLAQRALDQIAALSHGEGRK